MKQLPIAARIYVGAVIAGGALLLVWFFPVQPLPHPAWFVTLLLLSSITSAFKVNLPLARSGSTMSVSYAVDFLSLILLGPAQTMIVGAISAWSQCTFRMTVKNPPYRTLFSMASLVISVQAAGVAFHALGGMPGLASMSLTAMAKPLIGAAGAYFLCNTALVATAIALSTHQSVVQVWNENFLWSAPSYFVGAARGRGRLDRHRRDDELLDRAARRVSAVSHLSQLQDLPGPHRGRAAPRAGSFGSAPRDD